MIQFEFTCYDEHGQFCETVVFAYPVKKQAKAKAGRLAVRWSGPVDLHYRHGEYITTAGPSEHHVTGYRHGRIS